MIWYDDICACVQRSRNKVYINLFEPCLFNIQSNILERKQKLLVTEVDLLPTGKAVLEFTALK